MKIHENRSVIGGIEMSDEVYPVLSGADSLFYQGNEIGVILCHGFNGTPQSMQYIGEQLAKYGYTISIPRLYGHGTHYLELEKSSYHDWIDSLQSAYEDLAKICEKVYIVGQSMGGALTIQIAAANPEIAGVFLINAAITDVCYRQYQHQEEPRFIEEGKPDIKKPSVYEITYDKVPIAAVHQLLNVMEDSQEKLTHVTTSTVIFKSAVDHVVPPENSHYIFEHVNSKDKKMIELQNSYHVASMDYDAMEIVDNIYQHIQQDMRKKIGNPLQ